MSVTTAPETVECGYCSEDFDPEETEPVEGSFCSEHCYWSHKGDKALNVVRNDHRICGTCLRWAKSVEVPDEDWRHEKQSKTEQALLRGAEYSNTELGITLDATECISAPTISTDRVVGFQYSTEDAESVVKEIQSDEKYRRRLTTGTGCVCGCTDLSDTDKTLRKVELPVSLANHVLTFRRLRSEGKPVDRLDKDAFFRHFKETRAFEYSLGRALE